MFDSIPTFRFAWRPGRIVLLLIWLAPWGTSSHGAEAAIDFDADVRPILSNYCYHCHGPDEATREAGLRLDTADGAFEDLGGYAAFVPERADESEALRRILSDASDEVMPPPESKLSLSDAEKQTIKKWIEQGATWSEHWSFIPPTAPSIPPDTNNWSRNVIDRFVASRAQAAGLTLNPEASRETLIRRVTLDLTGLPPTPEEVAAFVKDHSDDAYDRVVDRLLDSPRYGERMAWEWLDAARYADTDGFQGDPTRTMWPWRDWLVNALNDNMPFDQFTIEMLAGDLLKTATPEQILATGFNRNHMFNGEGGRIAEETRIENVFDRAETTGTVWLGLTMTCCRCHDHKYDSISQEEYFKFFAFFNNTSETGRSGRGKTPPVLEYLPVAKREELKQIEAEIGRVELELRKPLTELDQKQLEWEKQTTALLDAPSAEVHLGPWWQLGPLERPARKAFDEDIGPEKAVDLSAEIAGQSWRKNPDLKDGSVFELPSTVGATFFFREILSPSARQVEISLGSDDAIKVYLNGEELLSNYASRAAAADQEKLTLNLNEGQNRLVIKIVNSGGIGGFYFKKTGESVLGLPLNVVDALKTKSADRQPKAADLVREHYRSKHWEDWPSLTNERNQLESRRKTINDRGVTVMVMDELKGKNRRATFILDRGGYDKPTKTKVEAGTPAALPPLPDGAGANRLTLARWLVDPNHPLTSRVTVNRSWQTFFGRGLVPSTEDFGSQGDRPTHPDLLDWLAIRFIESGWNVKQLHRLIVTSATYRQSSVVTKDALRIDPENRWLARAPRYRMPSWMLRDQSLAASGLLNDEMGGPSVKPYQPEGIWAEATFGKIRYQPDTGERLYRRSLYVFWRRIVGPTMFFDGAKRQTCEVKPTRTNTPLHALTTLNETTFVEASRAMAERVMAEAPESAVQRVDYAFQLAISRSPTDPERKILLQRLDALQQDFADHQDEAIALLEVGESTRDEGLDPAEHAAYSVLCAMILNLDETLSRP